MPAPEELLFNVGVFDGMYDTTVSAPPMNEILNAFGKHIPDLKGLIGESQEEVSRFVGLYSGLLFRNKGLDDSVAMVSEQC